MPVTVALVVVPLALAVSPPGDEVTVYPLIWDPPLEAGAVQVTVAWALPAVAVTAGGAPGGPVGMTAPEAVEAGPLPTAFVAGTPQGEPGPLVTPLTVALVAVPPPAAGGPPRPHGPPVS